MRWLRMSRAGSGLRLRHWKSIGRKLRRRFNPGRVLRRCWRDQRAFPRYSLGRLPVNLLNVCENVNRLR